MALGPEAGGECGVCCEAFRGGGGRRAPRQLPCRHSLCLRCLRRLQDRAAASISCPFCRAVAPVPEGAPGALRAPGTLPGDEEEEEDEEGSGAPPARPVAVEVAFAAHGPVFAVSGAVSPCGPEAPGAFVLGLPGQGLLLDTQPPPASMENLRLGFAAGILVLIVCTFFLLVFLK